MRCNRCGMEIDVNSYKRCPRCNTIVRKLIKCSECNGCSLYKKNSKSSSDCLLREKDND